MRVNGLPMRGRKVNIWVNLGKGKLHKDSTRTVSED